MTYRQTSLVRSKTVSTAPSTIKYVLSSRFVRLILTQYRLVLAGTVIDALGNISGHHSHRLYYCLMFITTPLMTQDASKQKRISKRALTQCSRICIVN